MKHDSSPAEPSQMIETFLRRAGVSPRLSKEAVISELVRRTASKYRRPSSVDARIQFFLRLRRVKCVSLNSMRGIDGALRPRGKSYESGFDLILNRDIDERRRRFTLAHEICHTFFYELVPEMKFVPHKACEVEEHLCDVGAAELLMPRKQIRAAVRDLAPCIESLKDLADQYSVSMSAMLVRLRMLNIWRCELTEWRPRAEGCFVLQRVVGGPTKPWEWEDPGVLDTAWRQKPQFGVSTFSYLTDHGSRFYRTPTPFQVARFGDRLLALWGPDIQKRISSTPLLTVKTEPEAWQT